MKKLISLILSVSLLFSLVPCAFAENMPNAEITLPSDAVLTLGRKDYSGYNYQPFTPVEAKLVSENKTAKTLTYGIEAEAGKQYYYRVSGENYVTYTGNFTLKKDGEEKLFITREMLMPEGKSKTYEERDVSLNGGQNEADIFLNINPQGHLKLSAVGDTYQIIALRSRQAVNNTVNNVFSEPDFFYTVTDFNGSKNGSVITVSESGVITAVGEGSALVCVGYDAMTSADSGFHGAIWRENTGVFVVSVGAENSGIISGMTANASRNPEPSKSKLAGDALDCEHDVVYYTGDAGEYRFTPETDGCSVYAANPRISETVTYNGFCEVLQNEDKSFTVPLTEGRNIVKLEKDGKCEYQIITAKKIYVCGVPETAVPGQELSIKFDTVHHPANKLAGIYNMSACITYKTPDGELCGGAAAQYDFASNASAQTVGGIIEKKTSGWSVSYSKTKPLKIPDDWDESSYTLSSGAIAVLGFGDPFGNHRGITYENGKAPNLDASVKEAFLGILPDITVNVTPRAVEKIEITGLPEKTEYFEGDVFDKTGMKVTATYENGDVSEVTHYVADSSPIPKNAESLSVTYGGKQTFVPITVTPLIIEAIEITKAPEKTEYFEDEEPDPTGMEVTAVYNSGKREVIKNYTYELLAAEEKIKVSAGGVSTYVSVSVTAAPASDAKTIKIRFTLLGDTAHGDNGEVHTMSGGGLSVWIDERNLSLPKGATVADAVSRALGAKGIPFSNPSGDYIENIRGLSEFSNGAFSGWMYSINGEYPAKGVSEQTLKNGDKLIFHYTDDYTAEKSAKKWQSGSSSAEKSEKAKEPEKQTEEKKHAFEDVIAGSWYEEAVNCVVENNLFRGISETEFAPYATMTRAMLTTVLWRLKNCPTVKNGASFADVEENMWYTDAIRWASAEKIASGYGNGRFGINDEVTREQMAAMLFRLAKADGEAYKNEELYGYSDFDDISEYALSAMQWALSEKIVNGKSKTQLDPQGTATRAEAAAMIMRFCRVKEYEN